MNDFTKEELESFFLALTEIEKDPFFMRKIPIIPACWWEDKLINKLKSMIDNYCEHTHLIECADCEILRCGFCKKASRK